MTTMLHRIFTFVRNRWRFFLWGPLRDEQRAEQVAQLQQALAQQQQQIAQSQQHITHLQQLLRIDRPRPNAAQRDAFYLAFEAEFRGSFADVQQRMHAHRHWVDQAPAGAVADLGCGRGEWLQLLRQWGRSARGVDLNALNVQALREQGFDVEQADAIDWLVRQPDAQLALLSAFHLAEHLGADDLLLVFLHAQRVLVPGGVLIIETPNAENLGVASHTFWLDPTHQRPLPAGLLDLLARHAGLEVLTVARLNAPESDMGPLPSPTLQQMLTDGRDIALIARKPA